MIYVLDTNILIYLIRNTPVSVGERINALPASDRLCMSFVSWAELLKGAERSTRKVEALRQMELLRRGIPVVYPDGPAICAEYARHAVRLRLAGTPIGGNDLWIAAHALAEKAVLVTNNVREFERVEGLRVENWVD